MTWPVGELLSAMSLAWDSVGPLSGVWGSTPGPLAAGEGTEGG